MTRWILLRGLTREAGHWEEFSRALAARSGWPVLPLDLAGNGTEWRRRSPLDMRAMADDLRRRAGEGRGEGPDRVVLVALSLGAMAAIEWCRADAVRVAGCALVNTSLAGASPFWQRLRPASYPAVARLLLPGLSLLAREERVLAMTSARPHAHPGVAQAWARIAVDRPVAPANALRQLWAASRYRAPATPPHVPVLLLASRGDTLVSPRCSQALARRWKLPLDLHPWAGHDLPLDDPDWLLDRLIAWSRTLR
jgi:pimeloyl-ACP methyl ester carboxylesterase